MNQNFEKSYNRIPNFIYVSLLSGKFRNRKTLKQNAPRHSNYNNNNNIVCFFSSFKFLNNKDNKFLNIFVYVFYFLVIVYCMFLELLKMTADVRLKASNKDDFHYHKSLHFPY